MKHLILNPATQGAQIVSAEVLADTPTAGCTVIEVDDDFAWRDKAINWLSLAVLDDVDGERVKKMDQISARCAEELGKGCASPKGWVDCDDKAIGRVNASVKMIETMVELGLTPPDFTEWTMFDKTTEEHSLLELKILGLSIGAGFRAKFAAKQAFEAAAKDATTLAELDAIDLEAGWP